MPAATYLGVTEHFEPFCNAVMAGAAVFQQAAKDHRPTPAPVIPAQPLERSAAMRSSSGGWLMNNRRNPEPIPPEIPNAAI
ncbi:MAG: hypothetical protein FD165_89 [Gammaproteobacteria bacterium]|nr:MAG: hypothetical protein FD165_89 [Gammaproteobacteria bacterium]TND06667.1 MAG: hypothetical protein FD120_399 [Gammaproteobacteria bacterium]